jgi:hypothetical protein
MSLRKTKGSLEQTPCEPWTGSQPSRPPRVLGTSPESESTIFRLVARTGIEPVIFTLKG